MMVCNDCRYYNLCELQDLAEKNGSDIDYGCTGFVEADNIPELRNYFKEYKEDTTIQHAKADAGKEPISLVPMQIVRDISRVRQYGNAKYGDPDNWRSVDVGRYRDALGRHLLLYLEDPTGLDEESGLPHLWHVACNVAFLCELERFDREYILGNLEHRIEELTTPQP